MHLFLLVMYEAMDIDHVHKNTFIFYANLSEIYEIKHVHSLWLHNTPQNNNQKINK